VLGDRAEGSNVLGHGGAAMKWGGGLRWRPTLFYTGAAAQENRGGSGVAPRGGGKGGLIGNHDSGRPAPPQELRVWAARLQNRGGVQTVFEFNSI
jgi:hypothetical protein